MNQTNGETKVGAYLCTGCGLGARLDFDQLRGIAEKNGAAQVQVHEHLCSRAGVDKIRADIAQGTTHAIIAACSRRAKTEAFHFGEAAVARVNLREGVIWTQPDNIDARATTQEMADDYLRMGCAEIKFMRQPQPSGESHGNRRVLVVGGGVSGLTAAIETARAGYEVLLVEKTAQLGGWVATLHRRLPYREPYDAPVDNDVDALIAAVESDANISIYRNASITRTSGAPGGFTVDIAQDGNTLTENIGAIVQASGFARYDANRLSEFSYRECADVIDQTELEALAKQSQGGAIKRPSDGRIVRDVVFVQCAGQRSQQPGHLPYCSGYCCNVSIKQALYFKESNPDIDANVIYTDLRTPGNGEDFYRAAQQQGVLFTNGKVQRVVPGDDGQLQVQFHDNILNQDAHIGADLVVLATGQVPNSGVDIAEVGDGDKVGDDNDNAGGDGDGAGKSNGNSNSDSDSDNASHNDTPAGQIRVSVESILNLDYRQGADLPHLKHGFSDSHFLCFPYETRRTGIYACGPVRRPMDIVQSAEDATGAALKAIQSIENAAHGRAAHPRSGDLSFPTFRREGCTQCKRCTVECPFGAIDEDEERYPKFNEARCRRCGTCMGACPVRVISFENYSVDTIGQQIKDIDMPDEFDEKPRILVLACENDAYPALDMAAHRRIEYNAFVRVIPIRCLGSVNLIWITDALNAGFDGIMLMGCKTGEDYQCHFVTGSALAHERMSKIDDSLEQLQLEPERVCTHEVEITDITRAPRLINEYAAKIDAIGMNPFKGF